MGVVFSIGFYRIVSWKHVSEKHVDKFVEMFINGNKNNIL